MADENEDDAADEWMVSEEDLLLEGEESGLEPGTPTPEHVAFVLLGVFGTVLAFSRMFAFL